MDAAAEFLRGTKLDHAHGVAVLLPKQHHGARRLRVRDGHVPVLLAREVGQYAALHERFNLCEFVVGDFLKMREVEAQPIGFDKRAFLLHVGAEHFAQGLVEEVGRAVVSCARRAHGGVHLRLERRARRHAVKHVDNQIVFLLGVQDVVRLAAV